MSNSSESSVAASGNRAATMTPEESAFSKTCNRLRDNLKQNGSLGFGTSSGRSQALPRSLSSSLNLIPRGSAKADVSKVGDFGCVAKKAQMTIFYGGQVMVFNDMPASKALEVMRLASIANSQATGTPGPSVAPNESIKRISKPILGEIPIARKQSLVRFLEKRKDRIMARSPYSAINLTMPADKSWLGLGGS